MSEADPLTVHSRTEHGGVSRGDPLRSAPWPSRLTSSWVLAVVAATPPPGAASLRGNRAGSGVFSAARADRHVEAMRASLAQWAQPERKGPQVPRHALRRLAVSQSVRLAQSAGIARVDAGEDRWRTSVISALGLSAGSSGEASSLAGQAHPSFDRSSASGPSVRTGFTSTIGVPCKASRSQTRKRLPRISTTRTRCSPIGFGRSCERVLKTPCSAFSGSSRGWTRSTSRHAAVEPGQDDDLVPFLKPVQSRRKAFLEGKPGVRRSLMALLGSGRGVDQA